MSDDPSPTRKQKSSREWPLPSWSKISEFVLNVIQIERSVETLKSQNEKLQDEIDRLQRQVDEQSGQWKAVMGFIQASLKEQVETSAERAAQRLFERLIALRSDPKRDDR